MGKAEKTYQALDLKLGFAALIAIFVVFGVLTLFDMQRMADLNRTIYNHPLVVSNAALRANVSITKMHRNMKDVVLFHSPSRIRESIKAVNDEEQEVYRHLDIVKNNILGEQGKVLEEEARKLFDDWRAIRSEVIASTKNQQRDVAAEITIGKGALHVARLEEKMLGLTNYARNKATTFVEDTERTQSRLKFTSIFFLMVGSLSSLLVAYLTLKRSEVARKKLLESEDRFKKLSTLTLEGLLINREKKIRDVNATLIDMFGYAKEELIGSNGVELLIAKESQSTVLQNIKSNETKPYEVVGRKKDGTLFPIEIEARQVVDATGDYRVAVIRDITDRKSAEAKRLELEAELRQKYKMEAVGYMAGGMAHNFNNNLSIILGNLELAEMEEGRNGKIAPLLGNAKIAVRRSRDLVQKIITYSRSSLQNKESIRLASIIDETMSLLSSTLPSSIDVQTSYSPDCVSSLINADPSQIQEILINLCNNAAQAMGEKGELVISLELSELSRDDIPSQYDCPPGLYCRMSVADSGCGIPEELIDKIFDPFFSTKAEYEGAGMGLSTVHGIVAQHGGLIKVKSALNCGSTFEVYLPRLEGEDADPAVSTDESLPRGTEKILYVDDDEAVARPGGEMLKKMGYSVSMVWDSQEALALFLRHPENFDLVITDQTMPGLTGVELIGEIKRIRPSLPAILCTGYSSRVDEVKATELGIDHFMLKPIAFPELLQTIRLLLDGRA